MIFNTKGLTDEQVLASAAQYGKNTVPESEPTTFWAEFKETFGDPMIRILLAISTLMIGLFIASKVFPGLGIEQTIFEPIGTIIAVLIVATIQAKTAVASDGKYRALKGRTKKDTCKAIRNGHVQEIDFDDIVTGDYVLLQAGDKIPADGILYEGAISVNNAALNGEPEECKKTANPDARVPETITGDTFVDSHSLFRGAIVFNGEGVLLVQKIGVNTMMGKMALEMSNEEPDSPLKVKLAKLAGQISIFGYTAAALIIVLHTVLSIVHAGGPVSYWALGWQTVLNNFIHALDTAILIVVCAVPEGLPLMISLVLMQNTSKMLDHNVLVRKAQGIETAGSLNILFSDKTGTITKGFLEVTKLLGPDGNEITKNVSATIAAAIMKNTQSTFNGDQVIGGNATDQALLRFIGPHVTLGGATVIEQQEFNSTNKFSQALVEGMGGGRILFVKGAPERILDKCSNVSDELRTKCDYLANNAMRLIALAENTESPVLEKDKLPESLKLIAIAAIRDDVRPEARDAIAEVQNAGVQVVMITGDRLETAVAIAKDAGLLSNDSQILTEQNKAEMLAKYKDTTTSTTKDGLAVSSAMLNTLTDDEVKTLVSGIKVIARALPTDKSRMVRICQSMNLVCGMTGDGVNDSPALKQADVGFGMGSGTEAAKEASDIVVLDDNFKSIKDALLYGRTIYKNILKFVRFQLMINVASVLVCLLAPFFGIEVPLTVVHLLFVNLVMDGLGSMMLGNEPALEEYMQEAPRSRDESIVNKEMIYTVILPAILVTGVGFWMLKAFQMKGWYSQIQLNSIFFVYFIWAALWNGFNVRSSGTNIFDGLNENPSFLKIGVTIALIQAAIVCCGLIPPLRVVGEMFSCAPFNLLGWVVAIALAILVIPFECAIKLMIKR